MNFNIYDYAARISNDINDIFYAKDNSFDSKIERIRNLAEIIGRFILDWGTEKSTTLGNIKEEFKNLFNNPLLINAVAVINSLGIDYAHTQSVKPANEKMVEKGKDALNVMYAFIFIQYFQKYEFGSNAKVERCFSLLPPIVRYKCLEYLYDNGSNTNRELIIKLLLALLKSSNAKKAKKWLDKHEVEFRNIHSSIYEQIAAKLGETWQVNYYVDDMPMTFYDECLLKINQVSYTLKDNGRMYQTFEEAIKFYELNGNLDGNTKEILDFNRNMEFVYAGRKTIQTEKNPDEYITANIWAVHRKK